jgi:hypothetical protein
VPGWLERYLQRHQHPVSLGLHIVGVPMIVAAPVLAGTQLYLDRWDLWWRPLMLLIVGICCSGSDTASKATTWAKSCSSNDGSAGHTPPSRHATSGLQILRRRSTHRNEAGPTLPCAAALTSGKINPQPNAGGMNGWTS